MEARHLTGIEMGLDRIGAAYAGMDCGRPAARGITVAGTIGRGRASQRLRASRRARQRSGTSGAAGSGRQARR